MHKPLLNFSLMLDALAELHPQPQNTQQSAPWPVAPSLADSLSHLGPLPREALLLGLASDGLPVLLNLHAAHPGPLLVAADPGAGKTALLQIISQAATMMHTPDEVQFGVITNHPDEWGHLTDLEHCLGIFPTYHNAAEDFLRSLSGWAHDNQGSQLSMLLLIDDLESMNDLDFDIRQTLRWLLLRGPARRVWPIITMNAKRVEQVEDWLEAFRTRIFGQIKDEHTIRQLCGNDDAPLRTLQPDLQFALREGNSWLKFWIPHAT